MVFARIYLHLQLSVLQVMMYRAISSELAILSAKCRIISSANKGWLTKVADVKPGHLVSSAPSQLVVQCLFCKRKEILPAGWSAGRGFCVLL